MLPDPGPRWICQEVEPKYGTIRGSSNNTALLFHRNPLLAIQSLLDRPTLLEHMDFAPQRIYQGTGTTDNEDDEDDGDDGDEDDGDEDNDDDEDNQDEDEDEGEYDEEGEDEDNEDENEDDTDDNSGIEASTAKSRDAAKKKKNLPTRERIYTEISTGDWWWRTQVSLWIIFTLHTSEY
jgi:hypothetical protein